MMNNFYSTVDDINAWIENNLIGIKNREPWNIMYKLIPDNEYGFVVDFIESFHPMYNNLTHIPIKLNICYKACIVTKTSIENLDWAPRIVHGDFLVGNNKLTSLKGSPKEIRHSFDCSNNQLTSLIGGPESVGSAYECDNNFLISLEGIPQSIGRNLSVQNNNLQDLDFFPLYVATSTRLRGNPALPNFIQNENQYHNIRKYVDSMQKMIDERKLLNKTISNPNVSTGPTKI